jgi:hypothetical protein
MQDIVVSTIARHDLANHEQAQDGVVRFANIGVV